MLTTVVLAAMVASICGSDGRVVNSSQGTDGSIGAVASTTDAAVSAGTRDFGETGNSPGANGAIGFPGYAPALKAATSWPELNAMGWNGKYASGCSPVMVGGDEEAVDGSVEMVSMRELGRDFFSMGGC
jgi:hypothetical protein